MKRSKQEHAPIGELPKFSPKAAAAFAVFVDTSRINAARTGNSLVYTVSVHESTPKPPRAPAENASPRQVTRKTELVLDRITR